jgi:tRNA-splicing ligase RtcB
MPIAQTLHKGRVPVHIYTDDIDHAALQQLLNIASLPIVHPHVAAMPDVHAGIGATVGSVIPTQSAIIPAAVGVDIGCGMNAVRTTLTASQLPDNLARLRSAIEAAVPVGFGQHAWDKVRGSAHARVGRPLNDRLDVIVGKHGGIMKMQSKFTQTWICQLGTLGGVSQIENFRSGNCQSSLSVLRPKSSCSSDEALSNASANEAKTEGATLGARNCVP